MRVLALVTDAYGGHGGIALYNRDVLESLCLNDQVTEVVAIARCAAEHNDPYPAKLTFDTGGIAGGVAYLKAVSKAIAKNRQFDVLLCCHINLMPLAWVISKLLGVPIVLEIYGIEAWQPRGKRLAEYLSSKVKTVISISEYTRTRYLSWSGLSPDKCKLLPNAIHAEKYGTGSKPGYLEQRYGLQGKKNLLTFGRIVSKERAKGFDEVVEVLPELVKEYPNIMYIIAGDGDYSPALQAKVASLGLNDYVRFTGRVDEAEKADLYRLADVYVMPSRGEGFGFVFLEAMACGIPVIASKVDGSREAVLDGQLGALVDPDKPVELRVAILEALKQSRKIPEKLEYFSFKNFTLRLNKIIDDVAGTTGLDK